MIDDAQLLREYSVNASEKAFSELVARYVDLVFSAAFRLVGRDHQLAEDVCQKVFAALAQKGQQIPHNVVLGGWLYRHTCFVAAQTVRAEYRRRNREEAAAHMNAPAHNSEPDWEELAPVLENAMQQLEPRDRDAIILRFFRGQNLRSVGSALGTSEDAARMRISRALDKLKDYFDQQGIRVSVTALAALLLGHAVTAAPVGLAAAITSSTLAAASLSGVSSSSATIKILIMKKIALGILGSASVAGLTASLVIHHQLAQVREENNQLRDSVQQLQSLRAENDQLKRTTVSSNELARLRKQETELLRLRNETGRLREVSQRKTLTPQSLPVSTTGGPLNSESVQKTKVQTTLGVTDTLITGGMETHPGKRTYVFIAPNVDSDQASRVVFQGTVVEAPNSVWEKLGINPTNGDEGHHDQETTLNAESAQSFMEALGKYPEAQILCRPRISTTEGVEATIFVGGEDASHTLSTTYRMAPDHKSLDLDLTAAVTRQEPAEPSAQRDSR